LIQKTIEVLRVKGFFSKDDGGGEQMGNTSKRTRTRKRRGTGTSRTKNDLGKRRSTIGAGVPPQSC